MVYPSLARMPLRCPDEIGPAGLTFRPEDPADLAEKVLQVLKSRSDERQARHEAENRKSEPECRNFQF